VDEAECRLRAVMLSVRDETANILDRIRLSDQPAAAKLLV
jgi:DNA-binding IscR family transcriptional regulator